MIRAFTSIAFSEYTEDNLTEITEDFTLINWIPRHNYHLTLSFIGDINVYQFRQIRQQLQAVVFASFKLEVKGLKIVERTDGSAMIWANVLKNKKLITLQKESDSIIRLIGSRKQGKIYKPHITLSRISASVYKRYRDDIRNYVDLVSDTEFGTDTITTFSLYSSRLSMTGSDYTIHQDYNAFDASLWENIDVGSIL